MKAYWEGKKELFSGKPALKQIDDKNYALSFAADSRKLFKIGVSFDSVSRKLTGCEVPFISF